MTAIPIGRIATGTQLDVMESALRRLQDSLSRRETEISSGNRVNRPSDDPLAAVRSLGYQARKDRADQYLRNLSQGSGELGAADGALGSLGDLANRAKEILLTQVGDTATGETRLNASQEVQVLLEDAVGIANQKFGDRYLFGGADASSPPLSLVGDFAAFRPGAALQPTVDIASGQTLARSAGAAESFGALSAEIQGRADLDPRVTAATKLSDLHGGAGIRAASIRVEDGLGGMAVVDLSGSETVGDVLDRLNATGLLTASVNAAQNGLEIDAAGGNLKITEVEGGRAAHDLGIFSASGAGAALDGTDLDPRLRLDTPLADLLGGLGLDTAGFQVVNGPTTVDVSLSGAATLEDLLNRINGAGAHLAASIGSDGNSIDLRSSLSGARLSVAEGSGATGAQLGLVVGLGALSLDRLNGGLGVGQGPGNDLRLTDRAGNSFEVDLASASTVQDVLNLINQAAGNTGTITASVGPGGNQLRIDDSSGGGGDLVVESINGSFSGENLGIAGRASASSLDGSDLKPAGAMVDSLFNSLIALRDALRSNDRAGLSLVAEKLDHSASRMLDARAQVGARQQQMQRAQSRFEDEKVTLDSLISDERGTDLAQAVSEFQREQTVLQASYAVAGRILSLSLLDYLR